MNGSELSKVFESYKRGDIDVTAVPYEHLLWTAGILVYEEEVCYPCRELRGKDNGLGCVRLPDLCDVEDLVECMKNYMERSK